MSKPAARIGDMHVCPMVTPGTPPIPHVGGPITGPGIPTVLIGGMPAAVLGDMCVCTGPPDTIAMGSTGVLIGGKPAARMGDTNAHGGTIVIGCPTVLIGEISGGGGGGGGPMVNVNVLVQEIDAVEGVEESILATVKIVARQIGAVLQATAAGLPFCEVCNSPTGNSTTQEDDNSSSSSQSPTAEDETEVKKINNFYFADAEGNPMSEVTDEESVFLIIESQNIAGEEVLVNLYDHPGDFTYQGNEIENNQLTLSLSGDRHSIELGVKLNAD